MTKEIRNDGIFYIEEGKTMMQVGFIRKDNVIIISKTFVDDSLRGQGKAGFLMEEIKGYAKENKLLIKATCSYARTYFTKHPSEIYIDDPNLKEMCVL